MAGVGQGEAGGCAPWLPSSGDGLWNLRVIDTQGCLLAVVSPGDMGVSYESQFTHTTSIPPPVGVMAASLGAMPSQDVPEMPRLAVGVVGREPERSPVCLHAILLDLSGPIFSQEGAGSHRHQRPLSQLGSLPPTR